MKAGESVGSSDIVIEMIKAVRNQFVDYLTSLFNQIMYEEVVPMEWDLLHMISLFKGKRDALLR